MFDLRKTISELESYHEQLGQILNSLKILERTAGAKRRGRPPGWMKQLSGKPRRGRPPGSKNKAKPSGHQSTARASLAATA